MVFRRDSENTIELQLGENTYYVPSFHYTPALEYPHGIPPITSKVAIIVYPDRSEYHGSIKRNLRSGQGSMIYADGGIYSCNWRDDLRESAKGQAINLVVNNGRYTGEMYDELMHGQGELILQNKDSYVGAFENGKFSGHGKYTYEDTNDVYEGTWLEGKRQGYGTFTYSDGTQYEGQWHEDMMQGYGTNTYPMMGSKYEGNHVDGQFHGHGTYTWKDGSTFSGNWQEGQMLDGTLQYKSGETVELNAEHNITFSFLHAPTISATVQAGATAAMAVESDSRQL